MNNRYLQYIDRLQILRKAGQDNWSDEVLEEFLRARDFPVDHTRLFVNVWNRESGRVRAFCAS